MIDPIWVSGVISELDFPGTGIDANLALCRKPPPLLAAIRAKPKSATRGRPSVPISTLSG